MSRHFMVRRACSYTYIHFFPYIANIVQMIRQKQRALHRPGKSSDSTSTPRGCQALCATKRSVFRDFRAQPHVPSLHSNHSRELSPTPLDLQDATLERCATNGTELRDVPSDAEENTPLDLQQMASQQDVPGGDVLLHGSDGYDSEESINDKPRIPSFRAVRQRWSAIDCDDLESTSKQSFLSLNHYPPCRSTSPGRYSPYRSVSPDPLSHGDYVGKPRHEASQSRYYVQYTKRPVVRTNYKPTPGCVRV